METNGQTDGQTLTIDLATRLTRSVEYFEANLVGTDHTALSGDRSLSSSASILSVKYLTVPLLSQGETPACAGMGTGVNGSVTSGHRSSTSGLRDRRCVDHDV